MLREGFATERGDEGVVSREEGCRGIIGVESR